MNADSLKQLNPKNVWENFEKLCQIPHPSHHEEKITQLIKKFGEDLGLETIVDEMGNVIIRKLATPGMENRKGVVLQSHLDMVPQKNSDVQHDFERDPIQAHVEGEWVKAKGTTLGADNGVGVAMAMAILQSKDIAHGPIEALFTVSEEDGMEGACALKSGILNSDILLNLDSEEEGIFYISCAGGVSTDIKLHCHEEKVANDCVALTIKIHGLRGGHSGLDINSNRGNAIKILSRLLWRANRKYPLHLSHFDGGSLRNAIPREAMAVVTIPKTEEVSFVNFVKEFFAIIQQEFVLTDTGVKIEIHNVDLPGAVIDAKSQEHLLNAIYGCPNGVMRMSPEVPDLVEASTNLGSAKLEKGVFTALMLQRSSIGSLKEDVADRIQSVFELAGAEVEQFNPYPGWKPNLRSPILHTMKKVYQEQFEKEPEVLAMHAGLECGLIGHLYPNMDMISAGPTIRHAHSPDEKVNIASVEKFWTLLVETLKQIPEKT